MTTGEIDVSLGKAKMVMWSWQNSGSENRAGWTSLEQTEGPFHRLDPTSAKTKLTTVTLSGEGHWSELA